jgi:hypothetical protein
MADEACLFHHTFQQKKVFFSRNSISQRSKRDRKVHSFRMGMAMHPLLSFRPPAHGRRRSVRAGVT